MAENEIVTVYDDHFIEMCKHGIMLATCRCPGIKKKKVVDCPLQCTEYDGKHRAEDAAPEFWVENLIHNPRLAAKKIKENVDALRG